MKNICKIINNLNEFYHSTSSSITLQGYLTPYYYNVSNDKTPIIPTFLSPLYKPNNLFGINPPYFCSFS